MSVWSDSYFTWYEFIRAEFGIELSINDDFQNHRTLQRNSGIFQAIYSEALCVVCKYPKRINWSGELMHSTEGVAVEWNSYSDLTKFDCYYINGRDIPEKHFKSISDKTFSMEDFINEPNEEVKSTCIAMMQEKYGDEYLVSFFSEYMKEVDTFVDKKNAKFLEGTTGGMNVGVYTLFKGEINNEQIAYVRCYCPSTDRMFFLGVENKHNNAKDAIASLYRVPRKLVDHIESINRQGERYSTIFTQDGNKILSSLSKEDVADLASVTGNKYFSLIKYEY
jgi:hypothetical protein